MFTLLQISLTPSEYIESAAGDVLGLMNHKDTASPVIFVFGTGNPHSLYYADFTTPPAINDVIKSDLITMGPMNFAASVLMDLGMLYFGSPQPKYRWAFTLSHFMPP